MYVRAHTRAHVHMYAAHAHAHTHRRTHAHTQLTVTMTTSHSALCSDPPCTTSVASCDVLVSSACSSPSSSVGILAMHLYAPPSSYCTPVRVYVDLTTGSCQKWGEEERGEEERGEEERRRRGEERRVEKRGHGNIAACCIRHSLNNKYMEGLSSK